MKESIKDDIMKKANTCEISLCRSLNAFNGFSMPNRNSSIREQLSVKRAKMNITCKTHVFSFGRATKQIVAGPKHGRSSQIYV